jgi:hypothetical protein
MRYLITYPSTFKLELIPRFNDQLALAITIPDGDGPMFAREFEKFVTEICGVSKGLAVLESQYEIVMGEVVRASGRIVTG